jgi:hypothetical protein
MVHLHVNKSRKSDCISCVSSAQFVFSRIIVQKGEGNDVPVPNQHKAGSKLLVACFMLISCLAYFSNLKMEVTYSSETTADFFGLQGVISRNKEFLI